MTYRITLRSNPRIILTILIAVALPGIGIASFTFWPPVAAVIATVVGGFFGYHFLKLIRSIISSKIVTSESGVSFDFGKGHISEFSWDGITHAGKFTDTSRKPMFYVYDETDDRLISVPNEYERFEEIVAAVRAGVGERFEDFDLGPFVSINEYLKSKIGPEDDGDAGESAATVDDEARTAGDEGSDIDTDTDSE